jgi:TolA-binding protein
MMMKRQIVGVSFAIAVLLFSSCARHSRNFYFGNYSEAEKLYNKGDYQKAVEKYQAYIDENPEGNLALIAEYYIAKSQQALGNADEAKKRYEKIIAEHPDAVWANFSKTKLREIQSPAS